MTNKIVLDVETQRDFAEVGGRNRHRLLRVSLAGIYSYPDGKYQSFAEQELHKLGEMLSGADQVIGFNIYQFDYAVLQPYLNFSLESLPTLDILQEVEKVLGHRISLEVIASATLGIGKIGSGFTAIRLWKNGQLEELRKYCLCDVRLTKDIYEFGQKNQKLLYKDFFEIREIPVNFAEPLPRTGVGRQSSLF